MDYFSIFATGIVVVGVFVFSYLILSHLGRGETASSPHVAGMRAATPSGRRWAPALNVLLSVVITALVLMILAAVF